MIRKHFTAFGIALVLALAGLLVSPSPAFATHTVGAINATGWVTLPAFPSSVEAGPVTAKFCVNGITGLPVTVFADGVANPLPLGGPTVCNLSNPPSLTANFTYLEPCAAGSVGFAEGTLTLTNGIVKAFAWMRVGTTAVIQLGDPATPQYISTDPTILADPDGGGAAVFVPTSVPTGCPGGAVSAYVSAAGIWV